LKANKVNLFVSSVLCVFWYHLPNVLDTLHICNISWLRVNLVSAADWEVKLFQTEIIPISRTSLLYPSMLFMSENMMASTVRTTLMPLCVSLLL
jgi:hypothetical protein